VTDVFGPRSLIARPGLIVGPHDSTDRFAYWPRRVADGGVVLAPGRADDPLQFIDVRDLARWIVHAASTGGAGTFNVTGRQVGFGEFIDVCCQVTGSTPELVWVPTERLLAEGANPWMGVPLWIAVPGWEAANGVDISKALSKGLTFRPLADTVRDIYQWDSARPARAEGLSPDREAELLARCVGD
jgi:2'-hydroxyisoflavone reductase